MTTGIEHLNRRRREVTLGEAIIAAETYTDRITAIRAAVAAGMAQAEAGRYVGRTRGRITQIVNEQTSGN